MSHPVSFVDFACGHSTPVSGSGGTAKRLCPSCAESNAPGIRSLAYVTAAMMLRDNQNTQPEHSRRVPMTKIELPDYIDPAVLVPGQHVQCVLDGAATVLTVVKVEPALICSKPDGTGVMVLAHTVVPVRDDDVCVCGHDFASHDTDTDGCEPFGLCAECLAVQP